MKKLFLLLFIIPLFAIAQVGKVTTHTVAAKESLSSIGRLYNINGRDLAKFNHIDYEKGLSLGQVLKIPASAKLNPAISAETNIVPAKTETVKQVAKPVAGTGTPIYHVVAKKETLYHISTLYGKVPVADIKKWNNLTSDALSEGTNLIVGYTNAKAATEPVKVAEVPVQSKKEEPKKIDAVVSKPVPEVPKVQPVVTSVTPAGKKSSEGFFKNAYKTNGTPPASGTAGVFKSTSGWEDSKYYCLNNTAVAGSIVKITNTTSQKFVFAKVLDLVPDLKQNNGLLLLVSDAAANELGAGSSNFECTISF